MVYVLILQYNNDMIIIINNNIIKHSFQYFTNHKLVPNIDENDSNVNEQFKYQEYFLAAVTLIANIPNFLFQLMNLFISDE